MHFVQLLLCSWWDPYLGYSIHSHNMSNLASSSDGDQNSSQILHHGHNPLAPCGHLGIGIHDTQAMRQAGYVSLLPGLHHHVHVTDQKHSLCLGMYDLWWKSINYFLFYGFDNLVQVSWSHGLICSHLTPNGKLCMMTCQQLGYSQPIQWNWQLISLTLCNYIYYLVDGWCAQNDWYLGSKVSWIWNDQGHLIFIVGPHSFHVNPYDNIAQGSGEKSAKAIHTQSIVDQAT